MDREGNVYARSFRLSASDLASLVAVTEPVEPGDVLELQADGHELRMSLVLENRPNPAPDPPHRIVDHEWVSFRLDPPDASLEWVSFEIDAGPASIFIGASGQPQGTAPLILDLADPELRVARMGALFETTPEASIVATRGAYLGWVSGVETGDVELEPEILERLRALGYDH